MPFYREVGFEHHFMMLLGNTLGNFDRDDILHGIKKSMEKDDVLLIGNGLNTAKEEKIIEPYQDILLDKFLFKVIEQIGLSSKDIKYDVRFKNSRVEMSYVLKQNKTVRHFNKKIDFINGDIILVGISYKYTKKELRRNILNFFPYVKIYTDKDNSYALVFCKK